MPKQEIKKLNRFTTLPFLLDTLVRKKLTLLNPELWEDYNDRKTIKVYQEIKGAKSIYALCLTYKNETVHHWAAFSSGPSGCCIEFSFSRLVALIKNDNVYHRQAKYVKLTDLHKYSRKNSQMLPFVKRQPFSNENEYRIIVTSNEPQEPSYDMPITLDVINRVTLSNKLPKTAFESIKKTLCTLEPLLENKIYRSTLFENNKWINHFSKLQNGS